MAADEAVADETAHRQAGQAAAANMNLLERHADPAGYASAVAASDGSDGYVSLSRSTAIKLGQQAVDQANRPITLAVSDINDVTAALSGVGLPEPYEPTGSGRGSPNNFVLPAGALGGLGSIKGGIKSPSGTLWGNIVSQVDNLGPQTLINVPHDFGPERNINVPIDLSTRLNITTAHDFGPSI